MNDELPNLNCVETGPTGKSFELIARYLVVGFFVGLLYISIAYAVAASSALSSSVAAVIAYTITTPISFFFQRRYTFRSRSAASGPLIRFLAVSVALQILGSIVESWMAGRHHLATQIVALWILSSLLNYLGYALIVFRPNKKIDAL
jgi:putative flippase GtrA